MYQSFSISTFCNSLIRDKLKNFLDVKLNHMSLLLLFYVCSFYMFQKCVLCSTVFSFLKTDHCWHIFWLIWKRHLFDQITIKMRNGVALQLVYYYYTYNFRIHSLFSMTMKYKLEYYAMLLRIKNISCIEILQEILS